jgi:hypothetical protein
MITLFRKIRQTLIAENKMGKYMKYAIGEILLVMVGILLALQVSNWNSDRIDRKNERKLLDNIHRDFVTNKVNFDTVKVINYRVKALLDSCVSLLPLDDDIVKQRAFWKMHESIEGITYNPYSSTVESVINSNSLQLIQDEELQKYLVSWKDVLLDYQEEENAYYKLMNDHYWPYFTDAFDYAGIDKEKNRASTKTGKFRSMVMQRRNYQRSIIEAIENEPIEHHINEIIRLTAPDEQKQDL